MRDVTRFLAEDLGRAGDITTRAVLGTRSRNATARLWTREPVVAAGVARAAQVFRALACRPRIRIRDGQVARAGATLLDVVGPAHRILTGERLALNLLGRMSGIATLTRRVVERVRRVNPRCEVAATRKTTPGFRRYEKEAVVLGGGVPHRQGLYDGILIKENHLALVPNVTKAIQAARARYPRRPVAVEVSTWADAREAAQAGAHWLLLDNLGPAAARKFAQRVRTLAPNVRIEISGGLHEANVAQYARAADRVSLGLLTHSAPSANVTLDWVSPKH